MGPLPSPSAAALHPTPALQWAPAQARVPAGLGLQARQGGGAFRVRPPQGVEGPEQPHISTQDHSLILDRTPSLDPPAQQHIYFKRDFTDIWWQDEKLHSLEISDAGI